MTLPGTEGYAAQADVLIARYEEVSFADKHQPLWPLFPPPPAAVLDIGAGTGADAAFLAAAGHPVVAVEPTDAFRVAAARLHPSPLIEWVDDGLPELALTRAMGRRFELVMLAAVWMHLSAAEREQAMPHLVSLLAPGGVLVMSLRHGPVPPERRMFEVSADETIRLAQAHGLHCRLSVTTPSVQWLNRQAGVTWSQLAFAAPV
jgi:SAM-dependent methyltransferase